MASDQEEDLSSRPASDSSPDETDSQDSDIMARLSDAAGVRRKSSNGQGKKASSDPNREKRKKAKRACRPCQVAHLTCGKLLNGLLSFLLYCNYPQLILPPLGDERPCSRCVKRGCSHICKDGVRKKAKYLADTPAEALTQELGTRGRPPVSSNQNLLNRHFPDFPGGMHRPPFGGPSPYAPYPSLGRNPQNLPPLTATPQSYGNHPGVMPPNYTLGPTQQPLSMSNYGSPRFGMSADSIQPGFAGDVFGNLDSDYLDNLNFDNRFGAAEFGMLGTMTSGITNSPPSESTGAFHSAAGSYTPNTATNSFAQSPVDLQQFPYPHGQGVSSWSKDGQQKVKFETGRSQPSLRHQESLDRTIKQEAPQAFAIGSSAYPSPKSGSSPQGTKAGREDGTAMRNTSTNLNPQHPVPTPPNAPSLHRQPPTSTASNSTTTPTTSEQTLPARRHRNPSDVYNNVKQPYSYTAGFHSLTAIIQGRFSPRKTAHIAKALAAIRPSFISCTMRLNRDDLIFMEKCLQRTLWGLEDVISATGTPTIICRRTGEVVAAGKEFCMLTGWSKDVLMGRASNLNVNKGGDTSGLASATASSRGGQNTPRIADQKAEGPVNIINLLDDESACDFFDDYAHLAFGDSRGTAITPCKLLKYQTAEHMGIGEDLNEEIGSQTSPENDLHQAEARGEAAMQSLGQGNGKIACMLCWTVKRDVFDIPMLFVMNVGTRAPVKKAPYPI